VRALALAAGSSHACALLTDGTVRCWGANYSGQLGDGTTTFTSLPVPVKGLSDVTALVAGDRHSCAVQVSLIVIAHSAPS
jgi:alpha-tubulin suppressor-like RCC1 family protein